MRASGGDSATMIQVLVPENPDYHESGAHNRTNSQHTRYSMRGITIAKLACLQSRQSLIGG